MNVCKNQAPLSEQFMNIIGNRVREIRNAQELTQDQFIARCNLLEWNISRSTLAKIESKVRRITDIEVKLLAKALKVTEQQLFDTALDLNIKGT